MSQILRAGSVQLFVNTIHTSRALYSLGYPDPSIFDGSGYPRLRIIRVALSDWLVLAGDYHVLEFMPSALCDLKRGRINGDSGDPVYKTDRSAGK